jgi:hypothetical protein
MRIPSQSSRAEFWRQVVVRQRSSGLSIHRFCVKENLATATFFAWKRRLSQEAGSRAAAVNFAPVHVVAEEALAAAAGTIEILLLRDRRIRVTGVVDRQQLSAVLAVLEA